MYRSAVDANKGSLYTLLDIPQGASAEAVRVAYKRTAMTSHPDRAKKEEAGFEEVGNAYAILSNAKLRLLYNIFGDVAVPLLLEHKYSAYIDFFVSKSVGCLLLLFSAFFSLGTVFYPYLVLGVKKKVVPWYLLCALPHGVCYAVLFLFGVSIMKIQKHMNPVLLHVLYELFLYTLLEAAVLAAIDGFIPCTVLYGTCACVEAFFAFSHLHGRAKAWAHVSSWRRKTGKIVQCLGERKHVLQALCRVSQVLLLTYSPESTLYMIKALPPLVWVICCMVVPAHKRVPGVMLCVLVLLFEALLWWVLREEHVLWEHVSLGCLGAALLFLHMLVWKAIRKTLSKARWESQFRALIEAK
ncbi:hypothetical protein NECID01_2008 [Nematocida sp. AWRm77]|nr:hypothetical protein NECID01_2008 [Nematocida sp. AWRm77]